MLLWHLQEKNMYLFLIQNFHVPNEASPRKDESRCFSSVGQGIVEEVYSQVSEIIKSGATQ